MSQPPETIDHPATRTAGRLITELSREETAAWCAAAGQPAYRADQIRQWLYRRRASSFDAMRDLPAKLRERLAGDFRLFASDVVRHQVAQDRTEKLLLRLSDGEDVECVLMREPGRVTLCISTQVGCAMGCVFCASGLLGVKRNLTTGEILEQVLRLDRLLADDERITNIVVMGMGEPLANLQNLLPALETLRADDGFGLGARRITVSTVGLPAKMRELAARGTPYNLAVSLHAPNDELRTQIVPVNAGIGIDSILAAADDYFERTGRRVTYEYVLLQGVNDETSHALQLADLLWGRNAHVNVIPMNSVAAVELHGSSNDRAGRFVGTLSSRGINVTVRKRKGADIDAACGQLRLHELTAPHGNAPSS
ncbi:MAG: 23S rRNA (adenine(2503)-C(2))-methyltransferase RlmN [Planctomycetota bacterium]|nr:MAG: 23S rRNA (adenine(2503)-C(2))-methyltransferase RlmN [Planctomycetota bacterium]REJ98435.1 MAG: 23S rRNA (adenine(2503)-C(2))-methyltransferase RlmN [Planctomycetota bacterium]REK23650.1 MAG: 23S rRNA (adenine(2503)-C(2))-methyltransferase RlmN [Planctomycetota bacterium]REK31123.1 MAG: 23S rRNA (adenine(2503)-C(2))-methyltransferase RlmN [Planctomycetota bacterium]